MTSLQERLAALVADFEADGMSLDWSLRSASHRESVVIWLVGTPAYHQFSLSWCYLPEIETEMSAMEKSRIRMCKEIEGVIISQVHDSEAVTVTASDMGGRLTEFHVEVAAEDRNRVVSNIRDWCLTRTNMKLASWTGAIFTARITYAVQEMA